MTVRIVADGEAWVGMLTLTVRRSMDSAYHEFEITTTDRFQEGVGRWNVSGGAEIDIYWNEDKIFSGDVNTYEVNATGRSHTISISGQSRAADLVNFGHEGPYFWKDVPAADIISDVLTPYGIGIDIYGELKAIDANGFRIAVDDTAFNIIQKIAEKNGLTLFTGNDGRLKMTDGSDAIANAGLQTGDYTRFQAAHTVSHAPSRLIVKSQVNHKTVGGNFEFYQRYENILENDRQPRYRPLVLVHTDGQADTDDFAQYAFQRFTGDSVKAFVNVKDVRDPAGALWGINQLVLIDEPAGDLSETLIISDMMISVSEGAGLNVGLTMREPRTYLKGETASVRLRRTLRRQGGVFGELFKGVFNV